MRKPTFAVLIFAFHLVIHVAAGSVSAVEYPRFADMGSPQAVALADRVLSWQLPNGGWGKNLPVLERAWEPGTPKSDQIRDGVELGTFDNGATTSELRFLAGVYAATGEERFKQAFERGLDFVLAAQYPSGGWPQTYPARGNYSDFVTYNDDAMVRVMELIRDVAEGRPPFGFVSPDYLPRLRRAFDLGIEYILKSQIVVDGRLTAWCQQHDPYTYEPRPGRSYEHVSISGSESVRIVRLLMSLPDPDERVREAILSALLWLDEARLPDGRWARFYEIGTNRPIFSGRDGVIKYDIMEIEAERREGYAWYGTWPSALLSEVRSTGYLRRLHASLPGFPAPVLSVSLPAAVGVSRIVQGTLPLDVEILPGGVAGLKRLVVTVGERTVYDAPLALGEGARAGGTIVRGIEIDTLEIDDGWQDIAVELTYTAPGTGGAESERRTRFVQSVQVRNRWTRSIAMRPPENRGWFGVIDHLMTSDRSAGWEFLSNDAALFWGDRDRIAWNGPGTGYLEWETPHLRKVRLVAFVQDPEALQAGRIPQLRMWVSHDRNTWIELDAAVAAERRDGVWTRLELTASPGTREIQWLRIEVEPGALQLGHLDLEG